MPRVGAVQHRKTYTEPFDGRMNGFRVVGTILSLAAACSCGHLSSLVSTAQVSEAAWQLDKRHIITEHDRMGNRVLAIVSCLIQSLLRKCIMCRGD